MTVLDIYTKLKNPPNLQEHMLRAAKVGLFIYDHWKGNPIDRDLLLQVILLHDVGNIVKFEMHKYPHFLGDEQKRINYWIEVQQEVIEKYGSDDHEVTGKMLSELKINPSIVKNVLDMSYFNAVLIARSDNWILKILLYADLRVSPTGIIPIRKRLDDVHSRLEKYKKRPDLYAAGIEIENQVQQNMDCNVSEITNENVVQDDNQFLTLQIDVR